MHPGDELERETLKSQTPRGITASVGEASRILGTSRSTLKRRASEWGIHTFWDGRGRRYSLNELEKAKKGLLDPIAPATTTLDLESIRRYALPGGYRFRVYQTGKKEKGYLGYFASERYDDLEIWISCTFGAGRYYVKLLDENNKMTGLNFFVEVDDPYDDESRKQMEELKTIRAFTRAFRSQSRQLRKHKVKSVPL